VENPLAEIDSLKNSPKGNIYKKGLQMYRTVNILYLLEITVFYFSQKTFEKQTAEIKTVSAVKQNGFKVRSNKLKMLTSVDKKPYMSKNRFAFLVVEDENNDSDYYR
jgi:hypothetical protein